MCTTRIHGEELPLHVEQAHVRAAAEGGVHEPAAPAGERRRRPEEPPRSALRVSVLLPAARSHEGRRNGAAHSPCFYPAENEFVFPLRGKCSMLNSGLVSIVPQSAASPSGLQRQQQPHPSGTPSTLHFSIK